MDPPAPSLEGESKPTFHNHEKKEKKKKEIKQNKASRSLAKTLYVTTQ